MAYLREIEVTCKDCRKARAAVELIDRWNDSRGKFCRKCGERALKKQKESEKGGWCDVG